MQAFEGSEAVGFFHGGFYLQIHALDCTVGKSTLDLEPVQIQRLLLA